MEDTEGKSRLASIPPCRDVATSRVPLRNVLPLLLGLLIVAMTAIVLRPIIDYGFVDWDDGLHVYANPRFQPVTWTHVGAFWQAPYERLYIPLTYTVWAALVWLTQSLMPGPLTAGFFHRFNILLHLGSVLVVYRLGLLLLRREATATDYGGAAAGALLFGLHPLQVEAVAWVSGLKDVLWGWWALLALWQYLAYVQVSPGQRRRVHYGLATAAFGLALLAKPAAVVVPVVAWLLATGGLGQTQGQAARALGVWLGIAVVWGLWTKGQQPDTALGHVAALWERPIIAADAVAFYLGKLVWPMHLGADYGRTPQEVLGQGWGYVTGLIPLGLGLGLGVGRQRLGDLALAGVVFVAGLLPILGGVSFVFQAYSTVADRYVYLALLGPALGLTWVMQRARHHWTMWVVSGLVLGLLGWRSMGQVKVWQDTVTLFTHTLQVNPQSALAHNLLGLAFFERGAFDRAITHYTQALRLQPDVAETHENLGNALVRQGRLNEAIEHYSQVLRLQPSRVEIHNHLGLALMRKDKYDEAIAHFLRILEVRPDDAITHNHLGIALAAQGRLAEAILRFARATQLKPDYAKAYHNLGLVFSQQGRMTDAIAAHRTAIRLQPGWSQAAVSLAWLLATTPPTSVQNAAEAVSLAEQAWRVSRYRDITALYTLAVAQQAAGQETVAFHTAQRALVRAMDAGNTELISQIATRFPTSGLKGAPYAVP